MYFFISSEVPWPVVLWSETLRPRRGEKKFLLYNFYMARLNHFISFFMTQKIPQKFLFFTNDLK